MSTEIVKIVMERNHDEFTSEVREGFICDMASMLGLAREDLSEVISGPGCVVLQLRLPLESALRLIELVTLADNGDESAPAVEIRMWKQANNIVSLEIRNIVGIKSGLGRSDRPQAMVLVHGWRGDHESFGKMDRVLEGEFNCPCGIYTYPTAAVAESPSFITIAKNLDSWIRRHALAERIAIVAHSYGGHVVREMLANQVYSGDPLSDRVRQVTFVASPITGSFVATLVEKVPAARKFITNKQVEELSEDDEKLFRLNAAWNGWLRRRVPHECLVRNVVVAGDKVVGAASAAGADPDPVVIFERTHADVVKCPGPEDELVKNLFIFFRDAGLERQDAVTPSASGGSAGARGHGQQSHT